MVDHNVRRTAAAGVVATRTVSVDEDDSLDNHKIMNNKG